jgi:lipid-A-disaccharide synthase-like uncharacterized protein
MTHNETFWLIIGLTGQGLFSLRFLVQWLKSEKQKRSIIPIEFWFLSLAGGSILLIYSFHRADPVFIIGQISGLFIYGRNLYFVFRENRLSTSSPQ